ncbi:MAG: chromate transporter [Bacteroidales bacterium]|nr:chromate transporter [Bacteroidales bacterium]
MESVSLGKLFCVFAKVGAFTIGGGYAMIPLVEEELVKRGWISDEDFQDMIVLAQSAPGLLAVNMAIFTGHKIKRLPGSIVAAIGAVLPSLLIILLIAMFFTEFKDNAIVQRIFQAVRPAAVALILVPAVRMAKSGCHSWWTWLIALASLLAVAFLRVSPIWIILVTITVAVSLSLINQKKKV